MAHPPLFLKFLSSPKYDGIIVVFGGGVLRTEGAEK